MKDVYGHETRVAEAWVLDGVVVQLRDAEDIVITTVTINYPRQITKFAPLNQAKRIMISGEGNGTMQLGAIIGPTSSVKQFIQTYGDICRVAENQPITLSPGKVRDCEGAEVAERLEFVCSGCILQGINVAVQKLSQDVAVLQAGMSLAFNSLQIK